MLTYSFSVLKIREHEYAERIVARAESLDHKFKYISDNRDRRNLHRRRIHILSLDKATSMKFRKISSRFRLRTESWDDDASQGSNALFCL